MTWRTPTTKSPGNILGATDWNEQIRDNLNHLLARPLESMLPVGTSYAISTGGAWIDLDAGTLNFQLVPASGRVMVGFMASVTAAATATIGFRVNVDAGLSFPNFYETAWVAAGVITIHQGIMILNVTAGVNHTFKLQVRSTAALSVYRSTQQPLRFWGMEI